MREETTTQEDTVATTAATDSTADNTMETSHDGIEEQPEAETTETTSEDIDPASETREPTTESPEPAVEKAEEAEEADNASSSPTYTLPPCPPETTADDYATASAWLTSMAGELQQGQVSQESLDRLLMAVRHDRDVVVARHEGEVDGRNQKIDEYLRERRDLHPLPDLGRAPVARECHIPHEVIGGLAAADRKSIWERGHERRTRR